MQKKISYKKIIRFEFRLFYIDQQSYAPTKDKLVLSNDALIDFLKSIRIYTRNFNYPIQSNCKLQVYYMSTKTRFNAIYCNHMFHTLSIIKSTFPTL